MSRKFAEIDDTTWQNTSTRRIARKTTATNRLSTTTMTADPDLVFSVVANSVWHLRGVLWVSSSVTTGDFKAAITVPALASAQVCMISANSALTAYPSTLSIAGVAHGVETQVGLLATGYTCVEVLATLVIGATAGNVSLTWAQVASIATNTTLMAGSHLIAERIG